ncbi:MAG TPA: DNA polymerase III subunit beta [Candidatus Pelethenecus faecipullorum]|uniref:Beta sliding clamp n=1 Tax=Candidatus Pelethenecus faecipullorum TaxID=2840900 RepID=A0A9D1GRB6_9MOLU|nr:DNA polymerase III subunit beta [Candidatus Pelethenecus faecipullorum]
MNFSIEREILLENLNVISRGLPAKSPMPILTGIKLEVTDQDLYMTSSNTDISVETYINDRSLVVEKPGKTVVPGRFFIDIIRKINSRRVDFSLVEDKILVIKADRGEYKLHIMDPLDYPNIDFVSLQNPLVIPALRIKNLIRQTVFACATSEKKPILTGVHLKLTAGKLTAIATDSFRLSQTQLDIEDYNDFNITVPQKALRELDKALDGINDSISFYFSVNKLLVKFKNVLFQTRLLDGNYPDTSKLIPSHFPIVVKFNKDELLEAVERVSLLSPRDKQSDREITYSIIKMTIGKDHSIVISTNNASVGDAYEELIPTETQISSPLIIGFSSRYLVEALSSFDSAEVALNFSEGVRPFVIDGEKDAHLIQLILPVRMD